MNGILNLVVVMVIGLVVLGLLYALPLPGIIKMLFNLAILAVMVIYVLQFLGFIAGLLPMPKIF